MSTTAEMQALFQEWVDVTVRRLPLYRRLCQGAAGDPEVAARLLVSPEPTQRIPNLLLSAVHDVVLAGDAPILGSWFSTVVDDVRAVRAVGDGPDDPWPHFREVALDSPSVQVHLETQAIQTNEVGRCAALLPAFTGLATETDRPLGLVEVGASAGLNLAFDRYGYEYRLDPGRDGSGPPGPFASVTPDAPLALDCILRGPGRPDLTGAPPRVASRVGLDLRPVDLDDPDQARWLLACQWPDQPDRARRASRAIELAVADPRRPTVHQGDAVADLADLVGGVDPGAHAVVFATWVLAYLAPEDQAALLGVLDDLAVGRDLTLLHADQQSLVAGLPPVPRPDGRPDTEATALVRIDWRDGVRTSRRLADLHPHATWIEWFG